METKTDPRVARTRKLIEDAFLDVMNEKGFEELSVQDVADRAGINRVTFYSHFVDRYALLRHAIRKAFQAEVESKDLAERALSAESVRDLFVMVCGHIAGLHKHCKPPHEHLDWTLGEVIADSSAELFVRWAIAGGRRAPKAFAEAAAAAGSSLYSLASRWNRSKKRGTAAEYVESTLPIVTGILGLH
ncbi:MAG TPA: TetR/AcrR family transcriptional regulator [Spirochaetia bacterium]|nr:TetR/AcrR family transcriptional regulator [Spirochaetia bacterium]